MAEFLSMVIWSFLALIFAAGIFFYYKYENDKLNEERKRKRTLQTKKKDEPRANFTATNLLTELRKMNETWPPDCRKFRDLYNVSKSANSKCCKDSCITPLCINSHRV